MSELQPEWNESIGMLVPPKSTRDKQSEDYTAEDWRVVAKCADAPEWRDYCLQRAAQLQEDER